MSNTWAFITKTATNTDKMNNKESVQFHYFNPNGLYTKSRVQQDELMEMVNAGKIKSGWLLAYDDRFNYNEMNRLVELKRVGRIALQVFESMWEDHIAKVTKAIQEVK